jgi:hypothetical protein
MTYYLLSVPQMIFVANGANEGPGYGLKTVQGLTPVAPPAGTTYAGEVEALNCMVNIRGLTLVQVIGYGNMKEYLFHS